MSNDMIEAALRLADVLASENDALKRLDFASAIALVPAKESALANLSKQSSPGAVQPPLAALGQHLTQLAAENQALLERAIAVQTRIVRIVARACVPAPGATRYVGQERHVPSRRAAAVALSTRA